MARISGKVQLQSVRPGPGMSVVNSKYVTYACQVRHLRMPSTSLTHAKHVTCAYQTRHSECPNMSLAQSVSAIHHRTFSKSPDSG